MGKKYSCNNCKTDPTNDKFLSGVLCKSETPPKEINGMCDSFDPIADSVPFGFGGQYVFVR